MRPGLELALTSRSSGGITMGGFGVPSSSRPRVKRVQAMKNKLLFPYRPKQDSWLNRAEIECWRMLGLDQTGLRSPQAFPENLETRSASLL